MHKPSRTGINTISLVDAQFEEFGFYTLTAQEQLTVLQEYFKYFTPFYTYVLAFKGYVPTELQLEMAVFLSDDTNPAICVQGFRSFGKSEASYALALWTFIHNPNALITCMAATESLAQKSTHAIRQLLFTIPFLKCLRPKVRANGLSLDRNSVEATDINSDLRSVSGTASLVASGLQSSITGNRSTLLIGDDLETALTSARPSERERIQTFLTEFVCLSPAGGGDTLAARQILLGTPHYASSIYNTHCTTERGWITRVFPARYPVPDEMFKYEGKLSKKIREDLEADPTLQTGGGAYKDRGKPTDPVLHNERALQMFEQKIGPSAFQLQYMLDTAMVDQNRCPLKTEHLLLIPAPIHEVVPARVVKDMTLGNYIEKQVGNKRYSFSQLSPSVTEYSKLETILMYIDPAGGGTTSCDETAYTVLGLCNSNLFILASGGFTGGYDSDTLSSLSHIAKEYNVHAVCIEDNYGHGAFRQILTPILQGIHTCAIKGVYISDNKLRRIISVLEPVMARGSLLISEKVIEKESSGINDSGFAYNEAYSLLYQLKNATRDSGSLSHDDRLDSLAGAVSQVLELLQVDQDLAFKEDQRAKWVEEMVDPCGFYSEEVKTIRRNMLEKPTSSVRRTYYDLKRN